MAKRSGEKEAVDSDDSMKVTMTDSVASWLPWRKSRLWVGGLVLMCAVLVTYQPVWQAGFIWDDDAYLAANPCMKGLGGLKEIWTTSAADISPLTFTTFWVEHLWWGLQPGPYHLVNVGLHAACAIVLWRVLRRLEVPGAWLGAALWALHPVEVESVAWITETKNTQSGLFFLLSILFFLRGLRAQDLPRQRFGGGNEAWTWLFAALAMASKSSTVILPVVLGLVAWWVKGRWSWRTLVHVGPIFFLSMAASALSIWTQRLHLAAAAPDPQWVRSWPERLATAGDAVWFYLGKLVWPHPLITLYPRWEIDPGQASSYLPLLAAIGVLFILWRKRESWSRPWFFTFAYFLTALLPVLGWVDNYIFRYSLVFDHFQYLASMGPLALAGAGLTRAAQGLLPGRLLLQAALGAGLLQILALTSWHRTWVYENQGTFWIATVTRNPHSWLGYNNLGLALFQKGYLDMAITQYQKALDIYPNYAEAHNNLGLALSQKGQRNEAITQFQKALEIDPNSAELHNNLGFTLYTGGQVDEAMVQFQQALAINPNYAEANYNYGNALLQKGETDEAIVQYQKALEINPDYSQARTNLGIALSQKGQIKEAITQFQQALEINPHDAEACNNLGFAFYTEGRVDEAIVEYQKALEINPNYSQARTNLFHAMSQKWH